MNKIYTLISSDYIIIKKEIDKIIKKENFIGAEVSTYDVEETSLSKPLENLFTYGLFSNKKVIIIHNIDLIDIKEEEDNLKDLYKYLKEPVSDNLLIITGTKLDSRLLLTKKLKEFSDFKELELNPNTYIKSKLKDFTLENNVINILLENTNGNISKLENEINKLKNYCSDTLKITNKDAESLIIKRVGDEKEITFSLTRAIAEKDKKTALKLYRDLIKLDIEPFGIVGLLASQIRIIYQVKTLVNRNYRDKEIAETLGEKSEYRVKKTRELIKYYTFPELRKLIESLADIDLKMKSTDIDPNNLIELFILNI